MLLLFLMRILVNKEQQANIILKADIIEKAKAVDKALSVSVKNEEGKEKYSWTFNEKELVNSKADISDVNLSLNVSSIANNTEIMDKLKEKDNTQSLVVDFSHEGILPAQAQIKIYVADQPGVKAGSHVYLYHYNTEAGKLETLPFGYHAIVDEDGYITFTILHCSDYVIYTKEADFDKYISLRQQISVTPSKRTLYMDSSNNSSKIVVDLPVTLEEVNSLQDNTSQSAMGGATISYKSADEKIASVDSEGNITAKGIGKTKIETIITIYSRKVKKVYTDITVYPYLAISNMTGGMKIGDTFNFEAAAVGIDPKDVTWTSSKPSVVSIDNKTGKAVAMAKGTALVIVRAGGIYRLTKVTVR